MEETPDSTGGEGLAYILPAAGVQLVILSLVTVQLLLYTAHVRRVCVLQTVNTALEESLVHWPLDRAATNQRDSAVKH